MMDKFYQSSAYKIYNIKKTFSSAVFKILRFFVFFLAIMLICLFLVVWLKILDFQIAKLFYLLLALCLIWITIDLFILYGLSSEHKLNIKDATAENLINYFSPQMIELFEIAHNLCRQYKIMPFNLSSLIFALVYLKEGRYFLIRTKIFIDRDLESQSLNKISTQKIDISQNEQKITDFLLNCQKIAVKNKKNSIGFKSVILALYNNNLFFAHLLFELDITDKDLEIITSWIESIFDQMKIKHFWESTNFSEGIGKDWAFGYTPVLNLYSLDITQTISSQDWTYQSKARLHIIEEMEEVLARSGRNNILLIGDPGVGKHTLVKTFAQKIAQENSYQSLQYKHVIELDTARILSGLSNANEIEARFTAIFNEIVHAGNVILYISNFASLISTNLGELGTIDASQFLIPYLESEKIQIIAGITYDDFKNKLQTNSTLETMFVKIEVKELSRDEVIPSIEHLIIYIEYTHKVIFTYQALKHLVEITDRYIHDEPFPQKAIDFITELATKSEKEHSSVIDVADVDGLISERIKIPTGEVKQKEKEKLLNLEKFLHQRIIGQDEAISAIANALRRSRAGLSGNKKPIGSFLFIGPTGIGKTETARALAQIYYGSEKNIIRFDMSEFQEVKTIDRLIGSKIGREFVPGRLTQGVKNNPYTLILFDELEKAHPNILNLLLQILDEGRLTDATGREVDFTNTIIIATSNAGSEKIREYLKNDPSSLQMGKIIVDYLLENEIFRPEFINRFDKVVCFKPLTLEQIVEVVKLMLTKVNEALSQKDIKLEVTTGAVNKLAREGYDPVFGARALRRLIQEKIENKIAKELISEEVKKGQTITLDENDV